MSAHSHESRPQPWRFAASFLAPFLAVSLGMVAMISEVRASTLDDIRARDHLVCGVTEGTPGFAEVAANGAWKGLDIDFCEALAVAVFGRRDAVRYRVVSPANRFQVLAGREVDVLPRANAMTLSRDTEHGVRFVGTLFHDGQGILVRRGHTVASVLELSGASVCVMAGSSAQEGFERYFQMRKMRYQLVTAEQWPDTVKTYADGACTLLTGDMTLLASERSRLPDPGEHVILPELVAKEPLGPIVRQGDDRWFSVVRWTLEALIAAEELGITSQNIDSLRNSPNTDIRRFQGEEADLGRPLGLARDWSYRVVKQVGNYGELFDRNVGARSPLALERSVNNLWTRGGLMSAAPLR